MSTPGRAHRAAGGRASVRQGLVLLAIGLWLIVQLGLPILRLVERGDGVRPRTFGWQMFTHDIDGSAERFVVMTDEGRTPVRLAPLLSGPPRREVVLAPRVVERLCARPGVQAVEINDVEHGTTTATC